MYFRIEKSGCSERLGLVQIRFDLFLDSGDYMYDSEYNGNGPFCSHFYQFEPTVTDAEIAAKGAEKLAMAYNNWVDGDLSKNKNSPRPFVDRVIHKEVIKPFLDGLKEMKAKGNPFKGDEDEAVLLLADTVMPQVSTGLIKAGKDKASASRTRIEQVLTTDFALMGH